MKRFLLASLFAVQGTACAGETDGAQTLTMPTAGVSRLVIDLPGEIEVVRGKIDKVEVMVKSASSTIYNFKGKEVRKYGVEMVPVGHELKIQPDALSRKGMVGLVLGGGRQHTIRVPENLQVIMRKNGDDILIK